MDPNIYSLNQSFSATAISDRVINKIESWKQQLKSIVEQNKYNDSSLEIHVREFCNTMVDDPDKWIGEAIEAICATWKSSSEQDRALEWLAEILISKQIVYGEEFEYALTKITQAIDDQSVVKRLNAVLTNEKMKKAYALQHEKIEDMGSSGKPARQDLEQDELIVIASEFDLPQDGFNFLMGTNKMTNQIFDALQEKALAIKDHAGCIHALERLMEAVQVLRPHDKQKVEELKSLVIKVTKEKEEERIAWDKLEKEREEKRIAWEKLEKEKPTWQNLEVLRIAKQISDPVEKFNYLFNDIPNNKHAILEVFNMSLRIKDKNKKREAFERLLSAVTELKYEAWIQNVSNELTKISNELTKITSMQKFLNFPKVSKEEALSNYTKYFSVESPYYSSRISFPFNVALLKSSTSRNSYSNYIDWENKVKGTCTICVMNFQLDNLIIAIADSKNWEQNFILKCCAEELFEKRGTYPEELFKLAFSLLFAHAINDKFIDEYTQKIIKGQ